MTIKENYLRAIYRNNPEWVPYGNEAIKSVFNPICERPAEAGTDVFGCHWAFEEEAEGGTYPLEENLVITDISNWREQVQFPDVSAFDWSNTKKQAAEIDKEQFLVGGYVEMGLFERSYLLLGMEEALIAYCTEPEEMSKLCSAIADYKIDFIRHYHEAARLDILWYGDDWGTQVNLFISPELWRKIIKPHTKRIYDYAKSLGIIVNQHSCGKIESIFGDIVEMGADIWNPCQPCNDLARLKTLYGDKICFFGGVDSQFVLANQQATPLDVENEVKKRIDEMALPSGGFIVAPSHGVPYTPDKLEALNRTIKTYGRQIYNTK